MSDSPIALSLNWNPFADGGASAHHALGSLLNLGGLAAGQFKNGRAPDSLSLSTTGEVSHKTVVSEVTTVTVTSNSAYTITTESAAQAADDAASGKAVSAAAAANGNVNVVAADGSHPTNNTGSIDVLTKVTYSDGTTATSAASLSSDFKSTGDGLARKRLDAFAGDGISEAKILKRLGVVDPAASAENAANAPTGVAIEATVNSDISVTLTYVAQGDQRSVSGSESGSGSALITTFDPAQTAYDASGALSTTQEQFSLSGAIKAGSLFSASSSPWLIGSLSEANDARTTIPGANGITIARQSTVNAEFATNAGYASLASQNSNAAQISFSTVVDAGAAGLEEERVTLSLSDASSQSQVTTASGTKSTNSHHTGTTSIALSYTPITAGPTRVIALPTFTGSA